MENGVRSIVKRTKKIFIRFIFLMIIIVCIIIILLSKDRKGQGDRGKVVICLDRTKPMEKYTGKENLKLDDCRDYVNYDEQSKNLLYVDYDNKIVEKNIVTGNVKKIAMMASIIDKEKEIYDPQYAENHNGFYFSRYGGIYFWDKKENQIQKVVSGNTVCGYNATGYWQNEYQFYFVDYSEDYMCRNLYSQNQKGEQVLESIGVESFIPSMDEKNIYCVQMYVEPNCFGFAMRYRIIKRDLIQKKEYILQNIDTNNFLISCVDDRYLFYIEEDNGKSKVYCLNMERKKKKCIYKTDEEIVGIAMR